MMKYLREAEQEYYAWADVVAEWRDLLPDLDMNSPAADPLCKAICLWGERLAALRRVQSKDLLDMCLLSADKAYGEVLNRG